jgi:pimeloyl-ACP methyl ester carboxylesterase
MANGNEFADFFYAAADGLKLHARLYGETRQGALPVVCLPGLTRNARDFHELALYLSRHPRNPRKVIAFDYRGRGQSAYDADWQNYNVGVEAADILAGLDALGIDQALFIGTSRGGLIIHGLAAMRPSVLRAAVLNDIGPVVENAGLSRIRDYLSGGSKPATTAEAIAAQRAVHGQAFPALADADWERMVGALYRAEGGKLTPDFDPALLNTLAAMDLEKPLPALWAQFEGLYGIPLLVIRGENSSLLSKETLAEMARRHPACTTIVVEGQGHAPFLETGTLPVQIAAFLETAATTAGA